jgi:hypothetical protein
VRLFSYILLFALVSSGFKTYSQQEPSKKKKEFLENLPKGDIPANQPTLKEQTPQQQGKGRGRGSQIVNDSTVSIYGPKTVLWITEDDFFLNKKNYQTLDTSLLNYHRWTYVQRYKNLYQDLGNVGTALNPIFPTINSTIGANSGFSVYHLYYDTEEPVIMDTESAFSTFKLVWGGNGRAKSNIKFSRNINPRWNFGFNLRPLLVDKQIQRTGKGDRQTVSYYYDLYSSYKSKDGRYSIFGNYRRIRHRVNENGGIYLVRDTTINGYFDANAQPYLTKAQTEEKRTALHIFHQYKIGSALQFYHMADFTNQLNAFHDDAKSETNYYLYFPYTINDSKVDTVNVSDVVEFKTSVNELGIKGNAAFLFYNFYYKIRSFSTLNKYVDETQLGFKNDGIEHYVGGRIAFRFDSLSSLSGKAEYLLDGNYYLEANLNTPWLDAKGISALSKPGFMQLAYKGSHNYWVNDFSNTFSNQLEAFLKVKWKGIYFSPGAKYTVLNNYIYFKQNNVVKEQAVLPVQSSGNQQLFTPEVRMDLRFFRHLYLRPQVIHSVLLNNDENALRIPEWFSNVQLSFENYLFKRNIYVQIGTDFHWHSSYTALAYDPAIQQYYIQDKFTNPSFPLVDVFFNGQFKGGRFFMKYNNVVQAITKSGYLPTPGYRGQMNIMDFGFDLILFD